MLNKVIELAHIAHEGQVDKGGHPYIGHPLNHQKKFKLLNWNYEI